MSEPPNAASVALFHSGKVLLIKRALPPYQHCWTLPGGRLEPGEAAADCAIREVREELGLSVAGLTPVTTQIAGTWRLEVFAASAPSDTPRPSDEIADWAWITPDDIAHLKTTPNLGEILITARDRLNVV